MFDFERIKDSEHVQAYTDPRIEAAVKELQAAIVESIRTQMEAHEQKDIRTVLLNMSECTLSVVAQICNQTIESHIYAMTEMEKAIKGERRQPGAGTGV